MSKKQHIQTKFRWFELADVLELGIHRVRARPLRAILSALGISIGIATMIAVVGIPASSQQALDSQLENLGTNILKVTSAERGNSKVPLPTTAADMIAQIGPVTEVAALGEVGQSAQLNDRIQPGLGIKSSVYAAGPELLPAINGKFAQGRLATEGSPSLPELVLGATAAQRLGIDSISGDPQQLWLGQQWFSVVGILEPTPLSPEVDSSALLSTAYARDHFGYQGNPAMIFVRAPTTSIDDVRKVLPRTANPGAPSAVDIGNPSQALAARNVAQATFSLLFLGLAGIALLVGGIGVANTMIISVLERRKEIGLRRALGATKTGILLQFFTESLVLCLFGGIAGILLGIAGTALYSLSQGWPLVVPPFVMVGGILSAVAIGVLSGVYPATRAAKLPPTEALAAL
ncbi:ABC transporter permease [Arthrobacter methylotrophus]|uniref:ABC transporter permease n=1 Tax=Arthrobacter methylotrophus TaxID=121291 RepID=A0ABV5UVH7_9MICC